MLAGGSSKSLGDPGTSKGFVEIGNRPMVSYLLDALRRCSRVDQIGLVMPDGGGSRPFSDVKGITAVGSMTENIRAGVSAFDNFDWILILAADIPLVTTEALDDFLSRCLDPNTEGDVDPEACFCYPVIRREDVERKFPGAKRTYAKLREGTFTGGNLALADRRSLVNQLSLLDEAYTLRKSPLRLLRLIGLRLLLKHLTIGLSIKDLERRVSTIIGGNARAIITPYPEIGVDVDKHEDLELVQEILN